jgi:hypothetical protein
LEFQRDGGDPRRPCLRPHGAHLGEGAGELGTRAWPSLSRGAWPALTRGARASVSM